MSTRTRVAVYGSSLHIAGIAASLRMDPRLEVTTIARGSPTARQALNTLGPAVIAFDLEEVSLDLAVSLLRDRPGLLLIGVDPTRDVILVVSGQETQAATMTDVVQVILRAAPAVDLSGD